MAASNSFLNFNLTSFAAQTSAARESEVHGREGIQAKLVSPFRRRDSPAARSAKPAAAPNSGGSVLPDTMTWQFSDGTSTMAAPSRGASSVHPSLQCSDTAGQC
jgi:hypothetical protein